MMKSFMIMAIVVAALLLAQDAQGYSVARNVVVANELAERRAASGAASLITTATASVGAIMVAVLM